MSDSNSTFKFCKTCDCETPRKKDGRCKICEYARNKEWKLLNPDKVKANNAKFRAANRESRNAAHAAWVKENPDKKKASDSAYRSANKEKIKEMHSAYYKANTESVTAKNNAYRAANPEKAKADRASWHKANREKVKAARDIWRKANPEKIKAYRSAWDRANPEKTRVKTRNRRAMIRGAGGSHTVRDIAELMSLQKSKCACCKCDIKKKHHVDHIEALVNGGSNDRLNLQLLCPTCNQQKHAKHPVDFMQEKGFLL